MTLRARKTGMRLDDVTLRSFGETILSYPGEGRGREGAISIRKRLKADSRNAPFRIGFTEYWWRSKTFASPSTDVPRRDCLSRKIHGRISHWNSHESGRESRAIQRCVSVLTPSVVSKPKKVSAICENEICKMTCSD